ncbi:hypothetical protein DCCM_2146 [Desulfocucumis palustris]|uniref:Uncharacterized protein n=1 Tax=Desulfocucumis palustris TaxID=1898651 RepID=A0A2L2X9W7_9FIRM|nr:hypothetical protein [Desulfocucumis palustris]GBF33049.1 hypothetical protein DCCM_2146 [Desulfocucumis palustris]
MTDESLIGGGASVKEIAARFLEAVHDEDAASFWDLLDSRGKGYFLGLWSYVLPNISLNTIISLSREPGFISDTMGSVVRELKKCLWELFQKPVAGEIIYDDPLHARVVLEREDGGGIEAEDTSQEFIPLVMELAQPEEVNPAGPVKATIANLTCWKIDTLKCLHFYREISQA